MTPKRKQRLILVGVMLGGVAIAVAFGVNAFKENIMLFHSPSDVAAGAIDPGKPFRIGGMVVEGSVQRSSEDLAVRFDLTDHVQTVSVSFVGILPDLFREGQGIVALGALDTSGSFSATEVLAKHDENYMPPEVADALERAGKMPGSAANYDNKTVVEP
ncbi:cytochrome c maturation protein CcmE [Granulosicoccus antarcticus]|uniref:Cytochrome c-type biogenesis protein CcmE n=1 Tax=Granulosicoccus antarcticus IMCC3135 TaxID=1192854 RepID=A0A2Z2P2X5_9GAMM|nr:cytochrome c maturation protein CcmE [Granulosicoccus antarcticus]ASJ74947.1 Cytochrome c-type biogenesis protein CcmE [Granulosicoccus antarcticus IMCC3135]